MFVIALLLKYCVFKLTLTHTYADKVSKQHVLLSLSKVKKQNNADLNKNIIKSPVLCLTVMQLARDDVLQRERQRLTPGRDPSDDKWQ